MLFRSFHIFVACLKGKLTYINGLMVLIRTVANCLNSAFGVTLDPCHKFLRYVPIDSQLADLISPVVGSIRY